MLKIHVNHSCSLPMLTCFGELNYKTSTELLIRANDPLLSAEAGRLLIDLRNAEKNLPLTDIYRLVKHEEFNKLREQRIALLVEPAFLVPYARVLGLLAKNRGIIIQSFLADTQAEEWLLNKYQLAC